MFTILPTIEDADTTCPKDTTASSWNKSGYQAHPPVLALADLRAAPWSPGPSSLQVRQQRSRQHHLRQRITNHYQLQLGKSDPAPDNTLATASDADYRK